MKKIIVILFISLSVCVRAQSIECSSKIAMSAMVGIDGTLMGTTGVAVGYIMPNGNIENSTHSVVGYVSGGMIQNTTHMAVGYLNNNGNVENAQHQMIGKVGDNGIVTDAVGNQMGKAAGVNKIYAAVCYFFYKLNKSE